MKPVPLVEAPSEPTLPVQSNRGALTVVAADASSTQIAWQKAGSQSWHDRMRRTMHYSGWCNDKCWITCVLGDGASLVLGSNWIHSSGRAAPTTAAGGSRLLMQTLRWCSRWLPLRQTQSDMATTGPDSVTGSTVRCGQSLFLLFYMRKKVGVIFSSFLLSW